TLHQVRERMPEPPSTIRQMVDRDLETICMKCLEKDPSQRYATAAKVADDLERWLAGKPIAARRAGPAERAWGLWRGHVRLTIIAVVAVMLLVTTLVELALEARARKTAQRLDREARRSGQAIREEQNARDVRQASRYWMASRRDEAWQLLQRQVPRVGEDDLRGFAWRYIARLCKTG